MRVMVAIGAYPPDHSGAGKRIKRTYEEMARGPDKSAAKQDLEWQVLSHPVRLTEKQQHESNVWRIQDSAKWLIILRCIFALIRLQPDIVHCVGLSKITFAGAWAARLLGIPYVFELSIDPPDGSLLNCRDKWFERPLENAVGYIALTPRIRDMFEKLQPGCSVYLRPNPVTLDSGSSFTPPPDNPIHLLLGRFTPRKGQRRALEVLARLPSDHSLILAGPTLNQDDEKYVEELHLLAKELKIENRIRFIPEFIDDVEKLMTSVTSIWCFSEREGLPNVVLEGLWLGRPAFVDKKLGLSHIIEDEVNGMNLDLTNESAHTVIEQSLSRVLSGPEISEKAKRTFDLSTHAASCRDFLSQCKLKKKTR